MAEPSSPIIELALDRPAREHQEREAALVAEARASARVGTASDTVASAGVGVPSNAESLRRAVADGIPTVHRRSGGTVVLVRPGDILWSIVIPRDPRAPLSRGLHAYADLGRGVTQALEKHGVDAAWTNSPAISDEYCLLGFRGFALSTGGRVIGGAAQHLTGRALLHHGIILRSVDRAQLGRLFRLPEAELERSVASLGELGVTEEHGAVEAAILRRLAGTDDG
ncbi:MAG TPA: hypothetical protein VFF67_03525 [Thermoplasmata archaeon]|nr:hypothetical protein [Thermoplasmata archaeon]